MEISTNVADFMEDDNDPIFDEVAIIDLCGEVSITVRYTSEEDGMARITIKADLPYDKGGPMIEPILTFCFKRAEQT
jgi:hypothetical protein